MKQLIPQTIRGKLLLWFLTTTTITVLLLGGLVSVVIWRVLHDQIDHHLHTVIMGAAQVVSTFPTTERNNLLSSFAMQRGMTVTILANDGFPLLQTNSPDVAKLSVSVLQRLLKETPPKIAAPLHFNVNDVRFATLPITLPEGRGLLAIGYSLQVVEQTFKQIIFIVIFILILALALSTYGIRILLTRYLKPIETIADKTNTITHSKDLTHRVSVPLETIELRSLTSAINSMLDRLELFFQNEHQFFSDAAHTLKTPLAIVHSYLDSQKETKERQLVLQEVNRASETIQDLIFISRMNSDESVSCAPTSISTLMTELSEIASVLAEEKQQKVQVSIQPNIILSTNQSLLRKALSNVIENAINYAPTNGTIKLSLAKRNDTVSITISDSGMGIPSKDKSRIFNRFYRGSNVKTLKGTGLGLAMVKAIVGTLGGEVTLESHLGHGTTVLITFNSSG